MVFLLYGMYGAEPRINVEWLQELPAESRSTGGCLMTCQDKAKMGSEQGSKQGNWKRTNDVGSWNDV